MKGKKLLAGILSAAMAIGTLMLPVFADDNVQTVSLSSEKEFQTIRDEITDYTSDTVTYEITGKVTVDENSEWVNILNPNAKNVGNVKTVNFVGKDKDAEIYIKSSPSALTWQGQALNVNYDSLTLSATPGYGSDFAHVTYYFSTELRCGNANDCMVTYNECVFPNGSCNNQYGKTAYNDCTFKNSNDGYYSLWVYTGVDKNGVSTGAVTVTGGTMEAARGVKAYTENATGAAKTDISLKNIKIKATNKPAVVASVAGTIRLENVDASEAKGVLYSDIQANKGQKELANIVLNGKNVEYAAKANNQYFISVDDAKKNASSENIITLNLACDMQTDSGYYMDGETKYGMMRFMFKTNPTGKVLKSGIKYINAKDIAKSVTAVTADNSDVFQGDIIEIPETVSGDNKYYAKAFVTTAEDTFWSEEIYCSVNWNKYFKNYQPTTGGAK